MDLKRPDLNQIDPTIKAYIEALEAELERYRRGPSRSRAQIVQAEEIEEPLEPIEVTEPPTTINVIAATASGYAKRTPRHLYTRQRRGGMGVFDLETPNDEPPAVLALADESQNLLLITKMGHAFRLPASAIPEQTVRARGESIVGKLHLAEQDGLAAILPIQAQGYIALASQTGMVRMLRHHVFGEYMKPGAALFEYRSFGPLASACWTPGDGELFIATRQGRAIRFSEKLVPPQGGLGIRLSSDDCVVSITPVYADSGVFLLGADGRGTIRQMEGFNPNKAPGAGGKAALATDHLVAAIRVDPEDEIFILSRLSKIIRFKAGEVPEKEGVVQGVNCMSFRADEAAAVGLSLANLDS